MTWEYPIHLGGGAERLWHPKGPQNYQRDEGGLRMPETPLGHFPWSGQSWGMAINKAQPRSWCANIQEEFFALTGCQPMARMRKFRPFQRDTPGARFDVCIGNGFHDEENNQKTSTAHDSLPQS